MKQNVQVYTRLRFCFLKIITKRETKTVKIEYNRQWTCPELQTWLSCIGIHISTANRLPFEKSNIGLVLGFSMGFMLKLNKA